MCGSGWSSSFLGKDLTGVSPIKTIVHDRVCGITLQAPMIWFSQFIYPLLAHQISAI